MSVSMIGGGLPPAGPRGSFQPPSFQSLDSDSSGSISLEELTAGAPGGPTTAGAKRAERLFKAIDADGDGSISTDEKSAFDDKIQERQQAVAFLTQQVAGIDNNAVFRATDTDGSGGVSLAEFSSDDAAKGASSDSLKALFDIIDSDHDGSISSTESSSFLDEVKSAVADTAAPPSSGGGGPPPASLGSSSDLLQQAQSSYSGKASASSILSLLQTLVDIPA